MGALQPLQNRLVTDQPAAHVQGLHDQPRSGVAIAVAAQLLPQLPPGLIRKQLTAVTAMQQRSGLAPERIDQMIQINRPGSAMALALVAMHPRQFACELAAQQDLQPIVVDPHRHLPADQGRRHRVDDFSHLDRAGAPHLDLLDVVVDKAVGRQRPQGVRRQSG